MRANKPNPSRSVHQIWLIKTTAAATASTRSVQPYFVLQIVLSIATAFIGIVAWSTFIQGYLLTKYGWTERVLAVAAAVVLINHIWWTDLLGFGLFALIVLIQWWKRNRDKGSGISAPGSA